MKKGSLEIILCEVFSSFLMQIDSGPLIHVKTSELKVYLYSKLVFTAHTQTLIDSSVTVGT